MVNYGSAALLVFKARKILALAERPLVHLVKIVFVLRAQKNPTLQCVITLLSHFQDKHNSHEAVHKLVEGKGEQAGRIPSDIMKIYFFYGKKFFNGIFDFLG